MLHPTTLSHGDATVSGEDAIQSGGLRGEALKEARAKVQDKYGRATLAAILEYYDLHGEPPLQRTLCQMTEINHRTIRQRLRALEALQYIDYVPGRHGHIVPLRDEQGRLLEAAPLPWEETRRNAAYWIPRVGQIAAGVPVDAVEHVDGYIPIAKHLVDHLVSNRKGLIALNVTGDSMTGDGILDGDIVVVHMQKDVGERDMVAVRIDDQALIKRVRRRKNLLIFESSNPAYAAQIYDAKDGRDVEIIGLVIAVTRVINTSSIKPRR